jgi:hypothetical protein
MEPKRDDVKVRLDEGLQQRVAAYASRCCTIQVWPRCVSKAKTLISDERAQAPHSSPSRCSPPVARRAASAVRGSVPRYPNGTPNQVSSGASCKLLTGWYAR